MTAACRVCGARLDDGVKFCGSCGAPTSLGEALGAELRAVSDPLVGRVVMGRYRLLRVVGRGGMGVVYEVEHLHVGRRLAMKLLHGELANDAATTRRLRREAEAASRLSHPGTVQVFDFGQSDGLTFLVMELVDGEDLGALLRREGPLRFERVGALLRSVLPALAEAHAAGIVHRDLKPENLMVTRVGAPETARVLDFGLAQLRREGLESSVTGAVVGTPYYMAPEQIRGGAIDARADVYAMGCVLYRALTGVPPFVGDGALEVLTAHVGTAPLPPSTHVPGLGRDVDALVLRCLEKKPEGRFRDVGELADAVDAALRARGVEVPATEVAGRVDESTRREMDAYERGLRRRARVIAATAVATVAAVAALVVWMVVRHGAAPETAEVEPNGDPARANPIAAGVALSGFLGRRESAERGDVDAYRMSLDPSRAHVVSAQVSGLPNLDLMLEVYRLGAREPVLRVDDVRGPGGEGFAGFPIGVGEHLLVVRERWIRGVMPTENVSDSYTISFRREAESAEGEPNGLRSVARRVTVATPLRGTLGWGGDVDAYCAEVAGGRFTVTPDEALDVAVAVLVADGDAREARDETGPGGTETVHGTGQPCVAVRASFARGPVPADPAARRYGLVFVAEHPPLVDPAPRR